MKLLILSILCVFACNTQAADSSIKVQSDSSNQPVKLRWLVTHAPNDYFVKMAKFFKERVEARTNGRVQVEILDDSGCIVENFGDLSKNEIVNDLMKKLASSKFDSPQEEKYLKNLRKNVGANNFMVELKRYLAMRLLEEGKVDVSQHYSHFLGEVYNTDYLALELPYLFMNYNEVENFIASQTAENLLESTVKSKGLRGVAYTFSGGLIDFISQKNLDMTKFENWKNLKMKPTSSELKKITFDFLKTKYQRKGLNYLFNTPISHRPTFLIMKKTIDAEEINLPDISYWLSDDDHFILPENMPKAMTKRASKIAVQETQHSLTSTIMMVRENVFNKLNEQDKKIFKEVAIEAGNYERNLTKDRYVEAKNKLVKAGFKWVEYPETIKKELKAKFEPLYMQVYKKYPNVKNVVEEIEKSKNDKSHGVAAI